MTGLVRRLRNRMNDRAKIFHQLQIWIKAVDKKHTVKVCIMKLKLEFYIQADNFSKILFFKSKSTSRNFLFFIFYFPQVDRYTAFFSFLLLSLFFHFDCPTRKITPTHVEEKLAHASREFSDGSLYSWVRNGIST